MFKVDRALKGIVALRKTNRENRHRISHNVIQIKIDNLINICRMRT